MAMSLEKSKKLNEMNKPLGLHPSNNPEILVKMVY